MNKSAYILAHKAGLFSLLNNVVTCMLMYHRVEVNWRYSLYSWGGQNLWDELFEPLDPIQPNEPHDTLDNYHDHDQWLTYKNAAKQYTNPRTLSMTLCHEFWKRIKVRPEIQAEVDDFIKRNELDDYISVMVRAHAHAGEQPSDRSQTLDEYASAIANAPLAHQKAFIMAGDEYTIECLGRSWKMAHGVPAIWFEDTPRMPTRDHDRHLEVAQTPEDARRVLVEVLVASRAKALIHPVSNMATAALYMNPELKSIYLP